jgi:hypothetical protein
LQEEHQLKADIFLVVVVVVFVVFVETEESVVAIINSIDFGSDSTSGKDHSILSESTRLVGEQVLNLPEIFANGSAKITTKQELGSQKMQRSEAKKERGGKREREGYFAAVAGDLVSGSMRCSSQVMKSA